MKSKDLSEMMISGDLGYHPDDDAVTIAMGYLKLINAAQDFIQQNELQGRRIEVAEYDTLKELL